MSENNYFNLTDLEFIKENSFFKIYYADLNLNNVVFHDLLSISLENSSLPLGLVTTLKMPLEDKYHPAWTFYQNKLIPNFFNDTEGFIHARNIIQDYFSNQDFKDLIVFDHGLDMAPFPGGKLKYFKNTGDEFSYLPTFFNYPNSFNFGGFSGDWDNDGFAELFICNLSNNSTLFFKNNKGENFTPANNCLPEIITQNFFQVLSGSKFKDHNGKLHMALGSSGGLQCSKNDLALINSGDGHFLKKDIIHFPERRGGADWATIEIAELASRNNTISNDLLFNYHDADTQHGLIDIYTQKKNLLFEYLSGKDPIYQEKDCWFPRIKTCSVSKNDSRDIVAIKSRGLKTYIEKELNIVFLTEENGSYIDHSEKLLSLSNKEFIGFLEIKNEKGCSDLIFMERSGNYFYCQKK